MAQTERAVRALASRLGSAAISVAEADRLAASSDLWPRALIRLHHGKEAELPAAVVWPESLDDLEALVGQARQHGLSLVPYGAGSSVVGGAMPRADQVVVDFKRMARLLHVDAEARIATAQAGILGELLERQLEQQGLTQGHFPSSIYCSTLGGWIAARSAGQMSSRYGKIEDQLLGGTVVLGDGRVLAHRPSPVRAPWIEELIGCEGALGLWAEATVRVHPLPPSRLWQAFDFSRLHEAIEAAQAWMLAGLVPCVVRIYDPLDSFLHRGTHRRRRHTDRGPNRLAGLAARWPRLTHFVGDRLASVCRCVVGLQGEAEATRVELDTLVDIAERHGGRDLGAQPAEEWYAHRYAVSYKQASAFRAGAAVDTMEVACRWSRVLPTYEAVRRAALGAGAQVLAHFSHVYVDGASIYFTYVLPLSGAEAAYDRLWDACLSAAVGSGANVSHHHGTGRLKRQALGRFLGGSGRLLEALRDQLDPLGVLNPEVLAIDADGPAPSPPSPPGPPGEGAASAEDVDPELLLCAAEADDTLAAVERRAAARGMTLGAAAALLPQARVLDAANRRWLWRVNPQLGIIESLVAGVDGRVAGREHRFVPAPRAAQGPDLTGRLLGESVRRLYLRCEPARREHVRVRGEPAWCVETARVLAGDEGALTARIGVVRHGHGTSLCVGLPRHAGRRRALHERLTALVPSGSIEEAPAGCDLEPVGAEPLFFAGSWAEMQALLSEVCLTGVPWALPWADPVGAAGLFDMRPLEAEQRAWLAQRVQAHGCAAAAQLEDALQPSSPPGDAPSSGRTTAEPVASPRADEPVQAHLRLDNASGALDNCTYCPKLCRFACPVAVAHGTETLTPRQLMLTVNLARTGRRALTPDPAARLWACVDCRGCKTFCEHGNDVATVLQQARGALLAAGAAPAQVTEYLARLREHGRPAGLSAESSRAAVLPPEDDEADATTGLFFGCQGGVGNGESAAAEGTAALARKHFGPLRVVRGPLACCGHPLWRWGDRVAFRTHATRFAKQLQGLDRLVVDDPGCAYALRKLYREVGVTVPRIVTTTSLLVRESWHLPDAERWAIHDDSYATRWLGEPSLRALIAPNLVGKGSVLEGESGCCGGMLLSVFDPVLADRVAEAAIADVLGAGADRILVASPTCARRLRAAGAPVDEVLALWNAHGRGP